MRWPISGQPITLKFFTMPDFAQKNLFGASFTFIVDSNVYLVTYTKLKVAGFHVRIIDTTGGGSRLVAQVSPHFSNPTVDHASAYLMQSLGKPL